MDPLDIFYFMWKEIQIEILLSQLFGAIPFSKLFSFLDQKHHNTK